jgi:septum formation topological specificity factor MinE
MNCEDRLKNILITDKKQNPQKIENIVKSEVYYIIKNYFELSIDDFNVNIDVDHNNKYVVNINFESNNIKIAHTL